MHTITGMNYRRISNNLYTLLICTPPLNLFVHVKNEIYCSYTKSASAFLRSRNGSKQVLLALGVDHTARDAVKAEFT